MTAKRIRLRNFQAHEDTVFELHPGINVITGLGDSGKTSIKRLIHWIQTNRPIGDRFMSHFANGEATEGTIEFDDGAVTHTKDAKNGSVYTVSGWEEPFRKVKTSVPDAAQALFRMEDINFQGQYDKPFLLTMTKGKLAKLFNRVASLDAVGDWLYQLKLLKDESEVDFRHNTTMFEANTNLLKKYEQFDDFEALVTEATTADRQCSQLTNSAEEAHHRYGKIQNRLQQLERYEGLDRAIASMDEGIRLASLVQNLHEVANKLKAVNIRKNRKANLAEAVEGMKLCQAVATKEHDLHVTLTAKHKDFLNMVVKREALRSVKAGLSASAKSYRAALEKHSKCPICFGQISSAVIEKEMEQYD